VEALFSLLWGVRKVVVTIKIQFSPGYNAMGLWFLFGVP
jgi:hypothetical protein